MSMLATNLIVVLNACGDTAAGLFHLNALVTDAFVFSDAFKKILILSCSFSVIMTTVLLLERN
jgi:hypothetical protein